MLGRSGSDSGGATAAWPRIVLPVEDLGNGSSGSDSPTGSPCEPRRAAAAAAAAAAPALPHLRAGRRVAASAPANAPSRASDCAALAAHHATEVAATAAALQQHLEAVGLESGSCAPAAAAAAANAAAAAAAVTAMVAAPGAGAAAAAGGPTSAAAAAMLSINVCSTALAALAPRAADLSTLNSEFSWVLDETEEYLDPQNLEGATAANMPKNRYVNIIPYDSNRVPLEAPRAGGGGPGGRAGGGGTGGGSGSRGAGAVGGEAAGEGVVAVRPRRRPFEFFELGAQGGPIGGGSSSYFNGSFIRDPTVDGTYACGYVATQGPLPSTVPDFWQAMRVAACSAVVMLTNYMDFGRAKCAPYFPETEGEALSLTGGLRIKCVHRTQVSPDLAIRQLEVCHPPSTERQWVNHYHYTAWPDHGVPPSTDGVRALCHALDDCRRAGCHIAVHCSAGVGRTGAFLAIDMLLQRLQRLRLQPPGAITAAAVHDAVDVAALVLALRRQRRGMVQTGAQYEFVYHALVDDLKDGISAGQEVLLVEAEAEAAEAAAAAGASAAAAAAAAAPPAGAAAAAAAPAGRSGGWARIRGGR
ncbi:hypothetical protein Rsub_08625 [Raphidocelis subcapitata]|uniref:Uncharacterized protein n=1 Tax=Raphidocelis subcapitata TaxID=307507 RepID=A0A2V0PCL2_9CHLO|nr:hypothetical protein Rsub_08625 [Raphidocelis subcapitata]|eukprot:GBF95643.1 hypothetical protein Rsub_08625 [Raphidocelis subcapitata]